MRGKKGGGLINLQKLVILFDFFIFFSLLHPSTRPPSPHQDKKGQKKKKMLLQLLGRQGVGDRYGTVTLPSNVLPEGLL